MRNVFDQYSGWENRLTHSLMTALSEDRRLLRSFLAEVARWRAPSGAKLRVIEQSYPGGTTSEDDGEGVGLPDGWIHDNESWSLLIESKLASPLEAGQLKRHLATARRKGFGNLRLLAIVVVNPRIPMPKGAIAIEWRKIYAWLQAHLGRSRWAEQVSEYMGIVETKMALDGTDLDGSLTEFTGFRFGAEHPYNYLEAKRVLQLATKELRGSRRLKSELAMDPSQPGRPAITRGLGVWDYLSLREANGAKRFTHFPHLTLVVGADVSAQLVIPNALNTPMKKRLKALEPADFMDLLVEVERNLRSTVKQYGATPIARSLHRHFRGQKVPVIDARLEFDLRTISLSRTKSRVRPCDAWAEAALAGVHAPRINYEIGIGSKLALVDDGAMWDADAAIDLVESTWLACSPVLEALRG